jgi:hypothetical protein
MSMIWFRTLRKYEHAMRIDEDVCLTRLPSSSLLAALSSDYAFGLESVERHLETVATFNPWLRGHMADKGQQPRILPLPTTHIYFSNVFVTRVAWWNRHDVREFLADANATGGIYRHRWGDAPIQTAALRLHALPTSVMHLDVDYVHLSTRNKVSVQGKPVPYGWARE